jgi:hypothetical protein
MSACKSAAARWRATAKVSLTWIVDAAASAVIAASVIGALVAFFK